MTGEILINAKRHNAYNRKHIHVIPTVAYEIVTMAKRNKESLNYWNAGDKPCAGRKSNSSLCVEHESKRNWKNGRARWHVIISQPSVRVTRGFGRDPPGEGGGSALVVYEQSKCLLLFQFWRPIFFFFFIVHIISIRNAIHVIHVIHALI